MLDFSDDELDHPEPAFKPIGGSTRVSAIHLNKNGQVADVPSQSIFKSTIYCYLFSRSFKRRTPHQHPVPKEPRVIDNFVLDGYATKPNSRLQMFDVNLKGEKLPFHGSNALFPESDSPPDSFFRSMRFVLTLAQFGAAFPVAGVRGRTYKSLHFKWVHITTIYWFVAFCGTFFCFICTFGHLLFHGILYKPTTGIVFFSSTLTTLFLLLSLARNWRKLNKEFAEVEVKFKKYGDLKGIGLKFKCFTVAFFVVATVEHLLAKNQSISLSSSCSDTADFFRAVQLFFLNEYVQLFHYISYALWKGVLMLVMHFLSAFTWNFRDLLLGLISWSIAERFKQVHVYLDKFHGVDKPIVFWKEVREDFNNLVVLTRRVDALIQKMMFLSMGDNLFFICVQLFRSLGKKLPLLQLLYFFWSFAFLVLRFGFVAFSAARINDESKEPKIVLYSVPQKNYSSEVRRFLTQLTTNEVALTGCGFFSITRSLILTIMGTVITYEIVLVQFSSTEEGSEYNTTICPT